MKRFALAAMAACLLAACARPTAVSEELNGRWDVQQTAGASLGEGVHIEVTIDARTGAMSGFTGCNAFDANITAFSDAIAIGAVREAPQTCASAAAATDETRFLRVLSSIRRFVRHGKSLELLGNDAGDALVRLRFDDESAQTP